MPVSTTISRTVTTTTGSTTTTTTETPLEPIRIIDLILADVNAVIPNFNSLVASYRLLVGGAEEIKRTKDICPDVFERAVRRADNAGTLIDVLLELLCCKIAFSSELLMVTCGPVDLVRHLATCLGIEDVPCTTAEEVVGLAALRRLQEKFCCEHACLPDWPVVCPSPPTPLPPQPPKPPPPPPPAPEGDNIVKDSDISDIVEVDVVNDIFGPPPREPIPVTPAAAATEAAERPESTLRPRHLQEFITRRKHKK